MVLLKYFWWLNVNSIYHGVVRGARKHLEKYKHSHLAVSFVTTAITHQILVKSFHSCVFEQLRVGVVSSVDFIQSFARVLLHINATAMKSRVYNDQPSYL